MLLGWNSIHVVRSVLCERETADSHGDLQYTTLPDRIPANVWSVAGLLVKSDEWIDRLRPPDF